LSEDMFENSVSGVDVDLAPQEKFRPEETLSGLLKEWNKPRTNDTERLKVFMQIDSDHNHNLSKGEIYFY